eukprot:TRINITY_DN47946_c4_g1_i1.p1 TRINITY_DN47946_c4_g1~~TRINITY_DN47946_c4_g1_i1.p1  ORF type:complete len:194 (+),score=39.82 TRINITY_DN47946_c4_g1_i1:152-733(+)
MASFTYKIVILGESGVGKTSLVVRFVEGNFSSKGDSTIGVAYFVKTMDCGSDTVNLNIWDTAGQERFKSLMPMYYKDCNGAIVVYDITDEGSFNRAEKWIDVLMEKCKMPVSFVLVGNKSDLIEKREVSLVQGSALAEKCGAIFVETSAKTGTFVQDVFDSLVKKLPKESPEEKLKLKNKTSRDRSGGTGCSC